MQTVILVIHLMVVAALIVVVLLQRSEGGALGMGGGSGFMTGRGQANVLTRATAILATLFFCTSLGLTVLANYGKGNRSIFETPAPAPAGTSQPAPQGAPPEQKGSVLDQLRRMEEQRAGGGAPAAPTEPTGTPQTPASQAPNAPKPAQGGK